MSTITATWNISLTCDCPHCKEHVDLLDFCDFWDGRQLDIGEHGTERSKAVEVSCPECGEDFTAELEY